MLESKNLKVAGIVVLAVVTCLGAAWAYRSAFKEPSTIVTGAGWLACASCTHSYEGEVDERPATCPKCGKKAVWPARRCASCKTVIAVDADRFDRQMRKPYCPKCGGKKLESLDEPKETPAIPAGAEPAGAS